MLHALLPVETTTAMLALSLDPLAAVGVLSRIHTSTTTLAKTAKPRPAAPDVMIELVEAMR
jgi:hypothetical protein